MSARGWDLLLTVAFVVIVSAIIFGYVLGGSARVRIKVGMLAREHPEAIAFAGYVYPLRFGTVTGSATLPSAAPRPFAFLADSKGLQIYGPWRIRVRRAVVWGDVAHVEFDVIRSRLSTRDGLTVVGKAERDSIDIGPSVRDIGALIERLEALRLASGGGPKPPVGR